MVLAQMLKNKQRAAEAFREGITEGRRQRDKEFIAWAKEKDIPFEDLPIEAGGYLQDFVIGYKEGIAIGRRQMDKEFIAWAKKKGISLEDLPLDPD